MMSRFLPYIIIIFLVTTSVLVYSLHSKNNKIESLNTTVASYTKVIEQNNKTILSLQEDLAYTENLLTTIQGQRQDVVDEHKGLEAEWSSLTSLIMALPSQARKTPSNKNEEKEHEQTTDSTINPTTNPTINLTDHFRVLQQSACRTNRDCL